MATVNFQCGHCSNLMAVNVEHLGQQVRCPHCQQVVLAPSATPTPPAPEPAPAPAPAEDIRFRAIQESEDIFHQRSETEDALFGQEEEPKLDFPAPTSLPPVEPAPVEQPPQPIGAYFPEPSAAESPPAGGEDRPTETFQSAPSTEEPPAWMTSTSSPEPAVSESPVATEETPVTIRRTRDAGRRINWFIPLVFIPLLLYAVLATAAVGLMYLKQKTAPKSLFEQMPDEGDTPGVRPAKKRTYHLNIKPKDAIRPLPEHLKVPLGKTLVIGALEVTPEKVERRKVSILAERADKPEPSPYDALVLHLRLRNLADDYAFTPMDNYFDRQWTREIDNVPLTLLQAGSATFFGGPAKWLPLNRDEDSDPRMWLVGRKNVDREGLQPGEEMKTYVATDGWDPKVQEDLFGINEQGKQVKAPYTGPLLWRVRVRRGLIEHKGREVSATAVIGVEFTDKAYATPGE